MKKASAIITADIHLRDNVPVSRTDDYWTAQWEKIAFIRRLQEEHDCPVLDGGDLLDVWKSSPYLLNHAITRLPAKFYTVPGNHEMPGRNLSLMEKSGLAVLEAARVIHVLREGEAVLMKDFHLFGFPYGSELKRVKRPEVSRSVAIIHDMVYQDNNAINPHVPGFSAEGSTLPFDLVISGHNHKSFVVRNGEQLWINPGSMMRMSADQVNFRPRVFLWWAEENECEEVFLPIQEDVIDLSHLETQKQKDARLEAFIRRVNDDYDVSLSFEKNLERYFVENKTRPPVQQAVWASVSGGE